MNEWDLLWLIPLVFLVICFFLEAVVLAFFKVNRLGRAFLYALLLNFVSLLAIYLAWPLTYKLGIDTGSWFPLFPILLLITIIIETLLLKWLNPQLPLRKLSGIAALMNLLSFAALYLVLTLL